MKQLLLVLLLLFDTNLTSCRPLPSDEDAPANKKAKTEVNPTDTSNGNKDLNIGEKEKVSNENGKCYFARERTSIEEMFPRDGYTKVTTKCGGELKKWKEIVGMFTGDFHGAYNEMDLLAARGAAEYPNFSDEATYAEVGGRTICASHLKELILSWNTNNHVRKESGTLHPTKSYRCGMPPSVSKHSSNIPRTPGGGSYVTREEAKQLLNDARVHVHVGTPLCREHKTAVSVAQCTDKFETTAHLDDSIKYRLRSKLSSSTDSETCSDDSQPNSPNGDQNASGDVSSSNGVCKSKFYEWVDSLKLKFLSGRKPYASLTQRSKRRKAMAAREMMNIALDLLAPGHADDLKALAFEHESDQWASVRAQLFEDLMANIVEEYHKQSTRRERRGLLSLVTSILPYSTVLKFFPGITRYEFSKSRRHGALLNRTPYTSSKREKYTKEFVIEFVDFVTSPLIHSDLPYGRRTLKKTDGSKLEVADSLRNIRAIEIIEMFVKLKTENGEKSHLMSRATMYKILDVCKATKREALVCVDYFISDALESFDKLFDILKSMKVNGYIDDDTSKDLDKRLRNSKLYLQTDFKLHVKFESKISDHCIKYALSDPSDRKFESNCTEGGSAHDHQKNMCEKCQAIRDIFDDLTETVKELITSAQANTLRSSKEDNVKAVGDLTIILNDITTADKNVLELKKHLIRNKHSNNIRQEIVENLKNEEAFLTLDWSQKVLPQQARESQSDYFGKSGISVHCTHVLSIDANGDVRQHNFVHITRHETQVILRQEFRAEISVQDSITVLLILENVLSELKKVGILRVHLRSDNAGCYHSAKTITSLPELSKKTGVEVLSYTFSEAQGGKGPADRAASELKRKLRSWLGSGKNAGTPDEIFAALTEGRVPTAMSTYLCSIDRSSISEGTTAIPGIQNSYDFRFNNTELTIRKFGGIGSGDVKDTTKFVASKGVMTVEKSGGYLTSDASTFWKGSKCKGSCSKDDDEVPEDSPTFTEEDVEVSEPIPKPMESAVFSCPEDECDATFSKFGNLERHIAYGKHKKHPERETLLDVAIDRYADNIEGVKEGSISTTLKEAFVDMPDGSVLFVNSKGWAQPSKKTNKRYDKEVVQYLMSKFEEAAKNKQKVYPKVLAQEVREKKKPDGSSMFSQESWLNYKQVLNLYQTFGRKRRELEAKKKEGKSGQKKQSMGKSASANTHTISATTPPPASSKSGRSRRPKRADSTQVDAAIENSVVIDAVIEELELQEFDDAEDVFDNNGEEGSDFDNIMTAIEKSKIEIFELQ